MSTNFNPEHQEGPVATAIEEQTAKLPSDLFLWAALGSMAVSATLQIMGKQKVSLFVGQWAPSFLLLGLYNKLVKLEGHD
jgi:hypothetical protein